MDLGFIMAPFKHSWQDGLERKKSWVLSPSQCILSHCLSPPALLSAPCISCRVVLADCGVVSKSSSQLLSPHPIHSLRLTRAPLPPSQTPAWTHVSHSKPSQYSRIGTGTVIVCLHYLCQCTVCGKWLRNAIIHSCHPALPSIRLMIFCNRPRVPWLLKSWMWEVGRPLLNWRAVIKFQCLETSVL